MGLLLSLGWRWKDRNILSRMGYKVGWGMADIILCSGWRMTKDILVGLLLILDWNTIMLRFGGKVLNIRSWSVEGERCVWLELLNRDMAGVHGWVRVRLGMTRGEGIL